MPNLQDNKVKRSNTINATAGKTKEAELAKKSAVPDPSVIAAQKTDDKKRKRKVNASVARANTFTKLKADSSRIIKEINNVKKAAPANPVKDENIDRNQADIRDSDAMFDNNERISEFSNLVQEVEKDVVQEAVKDAKQEAVKDAKQETVKDAKQEVVKDAKQEAMQNERTSTLDEGFQEILNMDVFKPTKATQKKRKRKEVEDEIEKYHAILEDAESAVFSGKELTKTKYATVGNFKKDKRIDKAIERKKYAAAAKSFIKSGNTDRIEYVHIGDTKALTGLINGFLRLSGKEYPLDTDENFIKNLEKNYQLTIEARKMQKYISDAVDGGYLPGNIDLEEVQKRIAGYEELKHYLDIRSKIITSPYYIYCASQDVNYTDEQLNRFIDGFADKSDEFKNSSSEVLEYLKNVQQLRNSKFVRKNGIKSLSGKTKSKAKHETKVLQTREEKRQIVRSMTKLDGDLKNRKLYGDEHYEKTFTKNRLRNTLISVEDMKLSDLHFADFADMADYGEVNAEIFERVKVAEQILYVAARKGELDGMDSARIMKIRAKLTAFKTMERLFESVRKEIIDHPVEAVDKLTYDEIWQNALNAIKEQDAGDNTDYPELGLDLGAFEKKILKTYKREAKEAKGMISQVQELMNAHVADERKETEAEGKIAEKDRLDSLFADIEAGPVKMHIGDLKMIAGQIRATFKEEKLSVREREKLLSERGTDQFKKNITAQTLKDNRKAYQNLTYEIKNKVSIENRIKIGDKTLDDLAALLNGNFLDPKTREEEMNRFVSLYADKATREQNLDMLTKYIILMPMETPQDVRYPNADALAKNAALYEEISSKAYAYRNLLKANPEYADRLKKRFGGDKSDYSVVMEKLNTMFAYSDYYRACRLLISDNYYILHGNDEIGIGKVQGLTKEARHTYDLIRLVDTCANRLLDREYEDRTEGGQLEKTLDLYEEMNDSQAYLTGRVDLKQANVSHVQDEQDQIKKFLRLIYSGGAIANDVMDYDPAQHPEAEKYRTPAVDNYMMALKTHKFIHDGGAPIGNFDLLTPRQRDLVAKLKDRIPQKDGKPVTSICFKDGLSKDKDAELWQINTDVNRLVMDLAMGMSDLASDEELIDLVDGLVLPQREDFKADDEASYKYVRERFLRSAKKLFELEHEQMKRFENTYGTMPTDCPLPVFMHSLGSGMHEVYIRGRFGQNLTEICDEKRSKHSGGKVDLGRILVSEGMISEEQYQDTHKKHVDYFQTITRITDSYTGDADDLFDVERKHADPSDALELNMHDLYLLENSAQKNNINGPHLTYSQKRKIWKDSISSKDKRITGGPNREKFYSDMFNLYSTSELKRIKKRRQKDYDIGKKTFEYLKNRQETLLQDTLSHMKDPAVTGAFDKEQKEFIGKGFDNAQKAQIKKLMVFHPGMSRDYRKDTDEAELKTFYTNVMAFLGFGVKKEQLKESKLRAFEYFREKAEQLSESVPGEDPEEIMSADKVRTSRNPVPGSRIMKMENCHQMYEVLQDMAADRKDLHWFDVQTKDKLKYGIFKNLRLECIRAVMMSDYYLNARDITGRYETRVGRNFLALKALGMAKTIFADNNLDRNVLDDKELAGFMKECGIMIDSFEDEFGLHGSVTLKEAKAEEAKEAGANEVKEVKADEVKEPEEKEIEIDKFTNEFLFADEEDEEEAEEVKEEKEEKSAEKAKEEKAVKEAEAPANEQEIRIYAFESEEGKAFYEAKLKEKKFPVPKDMVELVDFRNDHLELKYFEKKNDKGEVYMAGDYFWKEGTDPVFMEAYDWLVEYYRIHIDNFKETDPIPYNPKATAPLKGKHTPYEYQGNTLYCWACTMNGLMNEYAGHKVSDLNMIKKTPLDIPSFAKSGFEDRKKYNDGVRLANRMIGGNETGNPAIFGDYILNKLPNTAVCSAHIGIAPDKRQFCKRRFLETLGTRLEKGPVGLLHAGHFVLVYGIDGDRLKVRDSARNDPDQLREHYYTAEDIFNSKAREVELVWLEDIQGKEREIARDFTLDYNEQTRTFSGAVNREKETILHKNGVEGLKAAADGDLVSYQIYVPKQLSGNAAANNVQPQQQEVQEENAPKESDDYIYTAVAGATMTREENKAEEKKETKIEKKAEEKKEAKTEKKDEEKKEAKTEKKDEEKKQYKSVKDKVNAYTSAAQDVMDFYVANIEKPFPELEAFTGNIVALGEYLKDKGKNEDAGLLEGEIVQLKKLYNTSCASCRKYLNTLTDSKSGELKALKDDFQNKVKVISEMLEKDRTGIDQADASKGLSLNALLNDIRTEPFNTDKAEINEYVGGDINQRLHIRKDGQEFAFTETREVLLVENVMNRAIEKYPAGEAVFAKLKTNSRAQSIIPTLFSKNQDDFIAYKEGKATAENIEHIKAHFNQLGSTVVRGLDVDKLMADEAFLKSYYDVMSDLKAALKAEAGNDVAAIKKGRSIEKRNVAMTRIAEIMGISSLIANTKTASIEQDGVKKTGVIMEWVNGMTSDKIRQSKDKIDCSGDAKVLQQLADIEVLDFICGNVDRHMGNLIYTVENNRIVGVKGVDNDSSFGNLKGVPGEYTQYMTVPKDIMLMRQRTASMILTLQKEELQIALSELIAEDEIDDAWSRVEVLKAQIKQSIKEKPEDGRLRSGVTRILNDNDSMWDQVDIPTLASVCNKNDNNSIYKRMADKFRPTKAVNGIPFMADIDEYEVTGTETVKDAFVNIKIPKNGQFTEEQLRAGANFKPEESIAKTAFESELYIKMGIKDITDCIYVGGEKLKDHLQKKYGFKYEYGDQDKLKCFRAYMSAFAAGSTLTMTYVHPQLDKTGQPKLVICDLNCAFAEESAEMKTKREELVREARQTRQERHTSLMNALYPYTQYMRAGVQLKKTDIKKGAYRKKNQTYKVQSVGELVNTDEKCEYIFGTDTKNLPSEAKMHLAGNTLMNYCGLGGQITEVKPVYGTDEAGNVHYGARIASGYCQNEDPSLPTIEDLCKRGLEAGQPVRIEYTADAIRQLTGIRLMLSLFGDTGVDPVNDLRCVVQDMDRKDGYVVFISGFYLKQLSKPFSKSITGKNLKKSHGELKALDLKSLPAIDKETADSILSLNREKLKSLVGDMLGDEELEAMNSRLVFIQGAIKDEMEKDMERPEKDKRILSRDKWQEQTTVDRLQSELRKNPDSIFKFDLEGMQIHIEGSSDKTGDEVKQPQWVKVYEKLYGNLLKAIKSAKNASEIMEIVTTASFALASNAFGPGGTLEHDLADAVLGRIYNELMTKELAESYVVEKFASYREIVNSVTATAAKIDQVPKEYRNEEAIKGKIDSKVKRAKEKAKADNKPFDEVAERQKVTAEVEHRLKEQYAITLLVKEKPSIFLKQDEVKQFMQNISPISFTNKTLNMDFAGSVVPVVNDYADALAKTLPGGKKEYKEISDRGEELAPVTTNLDLLSPEKKKEAVEAYEDAITAVTKRFAQTVYPVSG